jgi:thioredoxin reductase (NADPH)
VADADLVTELDAHQLAVLDGFGARRAVTTGDVLYAAGDAGYDFFVVLAGAVEITGHFDGTDEVIARHGPGHFLGELNLLTGQRAFLTARVVEDGAVLAIQPESFRRLIATVPDISDTVLATLVERRTFLFEGAGRAVRVIGSRYSPESLALREFLARNRVPHQWLDVDIDPQVDRLVCEFKISVGDLPVALTETAVLRGATPGQVAQELGLTVDAIPQRCFDLLVVGSGPAGLAASVYGASEGLGTLAVESVAPGGQAATSSRIENYLGFPAGISGSELTNLATTQAL